MSGGCVYKIENTETKMGYVGSTMHPAKRWREHRNALRKNRHCNVRLQRAWNKYGENQFRFVIIEWVADSQGLLAREQFWINQNNANNYNMCPVAGTNAGLERDAEWREKASAAARRQWANLDFRNRVSAALPRRPLTSEQKRKMSIAKIGKKHSEATRLAESDRLRQYRENPALLQKAKESLVRSWQDDAVRKRRTEGIRSVRQTPESRKKTSIRSSKTYHGFISPDGEIFRDVCNLQEFCGVHGLDASTMSKVDSRKRKRHKGWVKL